MGDDDDNDEGDKHFNDWYNQMIFKWIKKGDKNDVGHRSRLLQGVDIITLSSPRARNVTPRLISELAKDYT